MKRVYTLAHGLLDRYRLKAERGPIRIALAGIGGWGASNAANLMRSRRFTIVGVCDIDAACADRFAARHGTKRYADYDELLRDASVSAVCLTVPNHVHGSMVKAAADAGKHVFVEKPLASTAEECGVIGEYCRERGVLLQVGHQMRREPVFLEIKRRVERGELGSPLFAHGVCALERRQRDDWRAHGATCPGGSMEQLGVHMLDALYFLFGPPRPTQGWSFQCPAPSTALDWKSVAMEFDCGMRAMISTSFSAPSHFDLELFFDKGRMRTDGSRLWIQGRRAPTPRGLPGGVLQFAAFADCIEHGRVPETGAAEARVVMNVIQSVHIPGQL